MIFKSEKKNLTHGEKVNHPVKELYWTTQNF